jgi:hypothetical protein
MWIARTRPVREQSLWNRSFEKTKGDYMKESQRMCVCVSVCCCATFLAQTSGQWVTNATNVS